MWHSKRLAQANRREIDMEASALTFASLDERIKALPEHPSYQIMPTRSVRWGNALVAASGISALLLGRIASNEPRVAFVMLALLAVEIGGLIVVVTAQLPSLKLTFANQRREYAETLDFDMPHHDSLVSWLCSFPRTRLEAMSSFATHRVERFRSKLPLMTGGIEKLGALPAIAALVVQFKDMRWPPHPSWTQIILFTGLMLFYWLCMLMLSQRFRLELYDALLKKALEANTSSAPIAGANEPQAKRDKGIHGGA